MALVKATPSCSSTDPSYLYWESNGESQAITFHDFYGKQWLNSDPSGNPSYNNLMLSPNINVGGSYFYFKQIKTSKKPYADYVRYGEMMYLKQHMDTGVAWYATGSPPVFQMQPSPSCRGGGLPEYDWCQVLSQTENNDSTVGVKFDDALAVQLYPCGFCNNPSPNPNYLGTGSPGLVPWACSPDYLYAIHDTKGNIPTQQFYTCCGADCTYASSPSGLSCSDCLSSCGTSGCPLPALSGDMKPFPGVASLPLASCTSGAYGVGVLATHTYTLTSGPMSDLQLLFILAETAACVTNTVPSKVGTNPPPGWGFLTFSLEGSNGKAQINGINRVDWHTNKEWQKWSTGCDDKVMTVALSMRGLSFTMKGTTQSASFIDLGYASGLYCNLYGVQGTADNNARFTVSGKSSSLRLAMPKPQPLAENWWWYGLLGAAVLVIGMIFLIAWWQK